jgi:GMP synthase-like glutamine amidotransferase
MLLIIARVIHGIVSNVQNICKTLNARNIPYLITLKCDPTIIRRKDIRGLIIPGSPHRICPEKMQHILELELYYLFHFPKLPVLGLCHGCQILMLYYGGDLLSYNSYWIGTKNIELELSIDEIFHGEERTQKLYVQFHDIPLVTPRAKKGGVREIAWFTEFRDGRRRAAAFEFEKGRIYGFMFHPEAKKETRPILYNFYDNVCMASSSSPASSASSSAAS